MVNGLLYNFAGDVGSSVPEYFTGGDSISIIIDNENGGTIGGKLDTLIHPFFRRWQWNLDR